VGVTRRPRNPLASSDARHGGAVVAAASSRVASTAWQAAEPLAGASQRRARDAATEKDAGVRTKPKSANLMSKSLNGDFSSLRVI
jgi:hypothetical protein